MNFKLDPKSAVLGAVLVLSGALAADEVPGLIQHVFKPGDPIRAAEVNANFANLGNAVQLLQGESRKPVTTDRLADGSVTAEKLQSQNTPGNGQVLGYQDGKLTWNTAPQGPKGDKGDPGPAATGAYKFAYHEFDLAVRPANTTMHYQCPDDQRFVAGGYRLAFGQGVVSELYKLTVVEAGPLIPGVSGGHDYRVTFLNSSGTTFRYVIKLTCQYHNPFG